jgi:excisionase family DNA binding protein
MAPKHTQVEEERYIGVSELSLKLGASSRTIYGWARSGILPHYRIGGMLRFKMIEVEKSLKAHTHIGPVAA